MASSDFYCNNAGVAAGGWYAYGGAYSTALSTTGGAHLRHGASTTGWTSAYQYFNNFSGLPAYIAITSVRCYRYTWTNAGGSHYQRFYQYAGYTQITNIGLGTTTPAWRYVTVARYGGGSWQRADFSDANFRVRMYSQGTGSGNPFKYDALMIRVYWDYIVPTTVTTVAATNIGATTARLNATINPNGDLGGKYRFVWGTSPSTYTSSSSWTTVTSGGSASYYHDATGLPAGSNVYFRVEYKNSGTVYTYGSELSFQTAGGVNISGGLVI